MNTFNYSILVRLTSAILKVSLMILALDFIYVTAIFLKTDSTISAELFITILLVSELVALLGSLVIGLPVAVLLFKINYENCITSAIICGVTVFLIVFYFFLDGSFSNIQSLGFFTAYGVFCGYAFMSGFIGEYNHE